MKITLIESRQQDAWFDLGLRQLRVGEVRFYRAWDVLTGDWLFKVCSDKEYSRNMVKAVKCPPGRLFSQLEDDIMVFQKSEIQGFLYDVISVSYEDAEGRVRRQAVKSIEEVPAIIVKNVEVKTYEEAKGKKIPGKHLVTLSREGDEKTMITLFLFERAWPLSPVSFEERTKTVNLIDLIKKLEKTRVEEVYQVAREQYDIGRDEIDVILTSLMKEGQVKLLEDGYIKSVD